MTPFEQALIDSILGEYENLPSERDLPYEFSQGFHRWAQTLLQRTHNPAWYYVNTTFKKAVIIAIIIGLLTVTAIAVPAIRDAIIDFFFTERQDSYGITFNPEKAATAPEELEVLLFPTEIDDTFVLVDQSITPISINGLWINEEGEMLLFSQEVIPHEATSDTWIGIDAEDAVRTSQIIGDFLVEIVWLKESYSLHWTDNAYVFSLEFPNSVSQEDMLGIFSSIKPME